MKKIQAFLKRVNKKEIIGFIALIAIITVPLLSFAKDKKIYVDAGASGVQNGSSSNPYKTIDQALDRAKKGDEVHVRSGVYKENIEIPKGVDLFGSGKEKVFIEAKKDGESVVKMNHKTKIDSVTVRKGKNGIEVGKNDKVSITKCIIEDNDKDGIRIKGDVADHSSAVSITDSIIRENGRAGLYSEKRRVVLMDNKFIDNKKDGVVFAAGVSAWIDDNKFSGNNGSGMSLVLDNSEILIASNNTFSHNKKEGMEINAYGRYGRVDIKKSKFHSNGNYGIVRIKRANFSNAVWNKVSIQSSAEFWGNERGDVSGILSIF